MQHEDTPKFLAPMCFESSGPGDDVVYGPGPLEITFYDGSTTQTIGFVWAEEDGEDTWIYSYAIFDPHTLPINLGEDHSLTLKPSGEINGHEPSNRDNMVELIQEQYSHENLNCQLITEAYSTWTPSIP